MADITNTNLRNQRADSDEEMYGYESIFPLAIVHHVTSDDQLPLLILVIAESPLTNIVAQIQFMNNFDFMHSRNNELE